MSHVRQQIREYVASQLTGLTTTGSNVYTSRVYELVADKLPALLVYTTSETSSEVSFSKARHQNRALSINVEGYVRARSSYDDTLDTIASEVETALLDDPLFGGLTVNAELVNTDIDLSGDGDQPVGTVRLTFAVTYRTETGQPDTAI
jgi:hypothetical protein